MRGDIFYEVKYLIHCIMYKGIGIEFCWVPSHCGLYWNEISDKLAKQGAMKNMSEVSSNNLLLSSHEINSLLKKTVYKQIEKSKFAIPSCSRYLARVIYKLRLNSWNTKYSQNVTCVCKNIRIFYLLNTYCLNALLLQSYFRKMDMTYMLTTMQEIFCIIMTLLLTLSNRLFIVLWEN